VAVAWLSASSDSVKVTAPVAKRPPPAAAAPVARFASTVSCVADSAPVL
jgi:hypothetical protein